MAPILIFGILSGGLFLDVLVGLLGSRYKIGFGWTFIISVIFTPLIGLIAVLLSEPLPQGAEPKYGCLGYSFGCLGTLLLIAICTAALFIAASLFVAIL